MGSTQCHAFSFFGQKQVHCMDLQKSIVGLFNCKYLGGSVHLKSIRIK